MLRCTGAARTAGFAIVRQAFVVSHPTVSTAADPNAEL